MGTVVGKVTKIDRHTKESLRGRFARVSVEIDLQSKLVPLIWVNDTLQKVEYEGLHMICFSCGAYGHRVETCSKLTDSTNNSPSATTSPSDDIPAKIPPINIPTSSSSSTQQHDVNTFGPWMLAPTRQRRNTDQASSYG